MFVFNPLSRVNVAGMALVFLSPYLLVSRRRAKYWHQRHVAFLLALAVGTFTAAIYRRIVVDRDSVVAVEGIWPLRFRRAIPVESLTAIEVDAAWAKGGTTYLVRGALAGLTGKDSSSHLLRGGCACVETACKAAKELGVPLDVAPGSTATRRGGAETGSRAIGVGSDLNATRGSDPERATEPSRGIVGVRAVVEHEDRVVAPVAEDGAAELPDLGGRPQPTRRLKIELAKALQLRYCSSVSSSMPMAAAMSTALSLGLELFPRLQRLAVVAKAPTALGAFRRAVEKDDFARLFVVADDVRLAAGSFHLAERPADFSGWASSLAWTSPHERPS